MDAERNGRPMTLLETIDRDLRAALSVQPSPEFVARVRTHIASEAQSAGSGPVWRWSFGISVAGIAAVVMATAFLVSRPHVGIKAPDAAVAKADIPPDVTTGPAPLVAAAPPGAAKAAPKAARQRHVPNARRTTPSGTLPEVLVDPREAAALRAVIAATRAGAIDLAPLVRASAPSVLEQPPIVAIAIAPLAIDPLEEGGRQ